MRSRTPHCWTLIACLAVLSMSACGKKGEPLPPERVIAAPTEDLSIHQQGTVLILSLTYPEITISGRPLPGLDAIEVWELVAPMPGDGRIPVVDAQAFSKAARRSLVLQGAELASAVTGNRVEARVALAEPLPQEGEIHIFAVRTIATGGEPSSYSNTVPLIVRTPIDEPDALRVIPRAEGIELSWQVSAGEEVGYTIYRRLSTDRGYGEPIARAEAGASSYLDGSAHFGSPSLSEPSTELMR